MKEAIYIMWDNCSKCHTTMPHVEKRASNNWYEFQKILFDDESAKSFSVNSIPMLVLREDWIPTQILDMDWIVALISNQK